MIALLLLALAAPQPAPPPQVFAVIVANNRAAGGELAPLSFADDDGARYFELFSMISAHVRLLSVLDAETQGRHRGAAAVARAPSRRELSTVLEDTFVQIEKAKKEGARTIFYFIYAGHGSVGANGQGEMHLLDGRFNRSELYEQVVERSPAAINHLIIDACNAYFLIARRGQTQPTQAEMDTAVRSFLEKDSLDRHPNTGVLVSTSKAADVHEWRRFSAGIFSHEVRSGLAGAADVDRDGLVRYDELRAFIGAANGRIPDPQARLDVYARAPAIHLEEPLFDRRLARDATVVSIPANKANRAYLEDQRGVRYADFNLASDGAIDLTLVPQEIYFLRSETSEIKIPLGVSQTIDLSLLASEPYVIASRGSEDATYQQYLFAVPFGRAYYEGYRASLPAESIELTLPAPERSWSALRVAGLSSAAAGVIAAGIGAGFGVAARNDAASYRNAIGSRGELESYRSGAESKATNANVLYGIGGGLVVTGAILWLLGD